MRRCLIFFVFVFIGLGCASKKTNGSDAPVVADGVYSEENFRNSQRSDGYKTQELETIPIEINEKVEMWIKYFQTRGRPHMERYLARSTRYEALMKKVLRDNNLPEDLFYIALIESGFSSRATSHASAVGYWQFIRGTGKRYKLRIDSMIDERRDPALATQAAADYFSTLYSMLDSWYLSMAAYNVGEGRVLRAVKKYKTKDFWELSRNKKALPKETDNYVPKYIAAKLIAKNPDKYGFDGIDYMTPIEFDHIKFSQPMNIRILAEKMGVNYEDFRDLNPKFKGEIAPTDSAGVLELRIPPGMQSVAMTASIDSVANIVDFVPNEKETQIYKVKRGDTLSTIARKYRTNIAYLRELNDLPRKKALKLGQRIIVPDRTPLKEKRKSEESKTVLVENQKFVYVVKQGDSLSSIAQKYKIKVSDLVKINNLGRREKIKAGARLILPDYAAIEQNTSSSKRKVTSQRAVASAQKKTTSNMKNKIHKVKKGDTLSKISAQYNIKISVLKKVNNISKNGDISVGEQLIIPSGS